MNPPSNRSVYRLFPKWLIFLGAGLLVAVTSSIFAQGDTGSALSEQRVKAAFLYKFSEYVDWPADSFPQDDTPITIAIMNEGRIATELAQLTTGRSVAGRSLVIKKLKEGDSYSDVHILFIGRNENARLNYLISATQASPILIVTEADAALAQGSVINFLVRGGRVRFEISLESAEKRALKLSSRLLSVAQNVYTGTP